MGSWDGRYPETASQKQARDSRGLKLSLKTWQVPAAADVRAAAVRAADAGLRAASPASVWCPAAVWNPAALWRSAAARNALSVRRPTTAAVRSPCHAAWAHDHTVWCCSAAHADPNIWHCTSDAPVDTPAIRHCTGMPSSILVSLSVFKPPTVS